MAGNIWGMDVEEVKQLAQTLGQKAGEIDQIISTIGSKVESTTWKGPDSEKFRTDWQGTLSANLKKVADSLRETQQRATQNAQQQEQASQ